MHPDMTYLNKTAEASLPRQTPLVVGAVLFLLEGLLPVGLLQQAE
jgi:hypothetical protein